MEGTYRITYINLDEGRKKCFTKHFTCDEQKKSCLERIFRNNIANLKITKMYDPPDFKKADIEKEILAKKRVVVNNISYVYALIQEEEIVYIGKSTNIMQRLGAHIQAGKKFTHYAIVETSDCEDYILKREAEYIQALKPKYNSMLLNGVSKKNVGRQWKKNKEKWF